MTSWSRNNAKAKAKTSSEHVARMQLMETLSEDLLGQIRGGVALKDGCHPVAPSI